MNCDEVKRSSWSERDGELDERQRERIALHRQECFSCRQHAEELSSLLDAARAVRAPAGLKARVLDAALQPAAAPQLGRAIERWWSWQHAAAVLAGIGLWFSLSIAWQAVRAGRPTASETVVARHLAEAVPFLESGRLPGLEDSLLDARPEMQLLARVRNRKERDR